MVGQKEKDSYYLQRTFALAKRGLGKTAPNPLVGAVIVKDDQILAEAYHKKYGGHHAERAAILKIAARNNGKIKSCAKGATIYVNLEPCNHLGKTPPCTDIIIESGISRVVFAARDINKIVSERNSIQILNNAGIKVYHNLLTNIAIELNKIYFKNHQKKEPYYILKTAMSIDGKIATRTGDSKWITGEKSRAMVQKLRYEVDAVLVGINTIIKDDSHLTIRNKKKNIYRIVLSSKGTIPLKSNIIVNNHDNKTVLVVSDKITQKKLNSLKKLNVVIITAPLAKNNKIDLKKLSKKLYKDLGICSILIEGGGTINEAFLKENLIDEYWCFISPKIIGGRNALTSVEGNGIGKMSEALQMEIVELKKAGNDILIKARKKTS